MLRLTLPPHICEVPNGFARTSTLGPALLEHRRLPCLLGVEDLVRRLAHLRAEKLAIDKELQFMAEQVGVQDTACDFVILVQCPGVAEFGLLTVQ